MLFFRRALSSALLLQNLFHIAGPPKISDTLFRASLVMVGIQAPVVHAAYNAGEGGKIIQPAAEKDGQLKVES